MCIGGDGTFAEVFNGLVLRAAKDQQIDPNDPDARLPSPTLPVGVIPSGSTDTVAYSLHGTTDVQTAAIHIIFGDTTGLDISSVHSNRTLLRLYASVLSYGYLGDVIRDSEKFRWMGPQRYDYSGEEYFDTRISHALIRSDCNKLPSCTGYKANRWDLISLRCQIFRHLLPQCRTDLRHIIIH